MPTEWIKTAVFLAVALLVSAAVTALAMFDRLGGGSNYARFSQEIGTELFPEMTDPDKVGSLEIVAFDEKSATLSRFRVAQNDGRWTIASHDGYPAEAKDRVGQATAALMKLMIDDVAPGAGEGEGAVGTHELHQQYGVVEPDSENINVGETGVGLLVRLADTAGETLASLIIGKQVPDSEDLHYVRKPSEDAVYITQIDPRRFSTKFEDWIEKDLLGIQESDVRRMVVKDYEVVSVTDQAGIPRGQRVDDRAQLTLAHEKQQWTLEEMKTAGEDGKLKVATLGADEQLNTTKIGDATRALADLRIASVTRKPDALGKILREKGDITTEPDEDSLFSLQDHGFYAQGILGAVRIFSDAGDLVVGTRDGVEYLLRFGTIDPTSRKSVGATDDAKSPKADSSSEPEVSLNRFVFVTTRVNEKLIPPPNLKPVPGEEASPKPSADGKTSVDGKNSAAAKEAGDSQPQAKPAEGEPDSNKKDGAGDASRDPFEKPGDGTCGPAADAETSGDETDQAGDEAAAAAKDDDEKSSDAPSPADKGEGGDKDTRQPKTADTSPPKAQNDEPAAKTKPADNAAAPGEDAAAAEDRQRQLEARKEKILAENKAAQDEYDKQVQAAHDKVAKLNDRFADWYFVVPEETYKKIRLTKDELIEKKEKPAEGLQPPAGQGGLPGIEGLKLPNLGR